MFYERDSFLLSIDRKVRHAALQSSKFLTCTDIWAG